MAKTTLNLRVEEDVKNRAESVLSQLGISMTAAVVLYLKAISREKAIPFDLKLNGNVAEPKKKKSATTAKKPKKAEKPSKNVDFDSDDDLFDLPGSSSLLDAIKKI